MRRKMGTPATDLILSRLRFRQISRCRQFARLSTKKRCELKFYRKAQSAVPLRQERRFAPISAPSGKIYVRCLAPRSAKAA